MTAIGYLVHNLRDAAVRRRVEMFTAGGASVRLAGFCREDTAPPTVAGAPAVMLGQTRDADLGQRARAVVSALLSPRALLDTCAGADVIVARNLETLVLGAYAAARLGTPRLVYESLDIHRSLLGPGVKARAMRLVERLLVGRCDLLLTSSPAFWREYFAPFQGFALPHQLVENKLLDLAGTLTASTPPAPVEGPPWRIGWFGNLRCRRTLATLSACAASAGGAIEIIVAGKPSEAEFPDFAAEVAKPFVTYLGPYQADQLPALYARCHFAWAIDYFEEGLNSNWLLPNRLYEALACGAIPIALDGVETGRWLAARGVGVLLPRGGESQRLGAFLGALDRVEVERLRQAAATIAREEVVAGHDDCAGLVKAVAGL